jgi:hypothetical protein
MVSLRDSLRQPRLLSSPLPPRSGGEGSGVGGLSAGTAASVNAALPPTPDPSPPRALRAGGGEEESDASRFATSSLVPRVDARARCAAASPPARRSQELFGGGCNPVPEPMPASPRLIAGLSSSASAGPIGCTSGRWALDFGVLRGFLGLSGFFAMGRIWDESGRHKRAKTRRNAWWQELAANLLRH